MAQLIRDLDLLPQLLGQDWSSVFLQRFDGTVTYVLLSMILKLISPHPLQDMASHSILGMLVSPMI